MKTIRISDEVHGRLKGLVNGNTISEVIVQLLDGVSSRTDLDKVLDQLELIFSAIDKLDVPQHQIDNILTEYGGEPRETIDTESIAERMERIRKEKEARLTAQRNVVNNPEEENQTVW